MSFDSRISGKHRGYELNGPSKVKGMPKNRWDMGKIPPKYFVLVANHARFIPQIACRLPLDQIWKLFRELGGNMVSRLEIECFM
jgi:hypothetical protein